MRAVIDAVRPCVDGGRFAAKRVEGETVTVEADCFTDGHDVLRVLLRWRAGSSDRLAGRRDDGRRQRPSGTAASSPGRRGATSIRWSPGSIVSCPGATSSSGARRRGHRTCRAGRRRPGARGDGARPARGPRRARPTGRPASSRTPCAAAGDPQAQALKALALDSRPRATGDALPGPSRAETLAGGAAAGRRPRARALLDLVRTVSALLRRHRAGPSRHVAGLRGAPALRRRAGLRRALPAADPPDRARPAQGQEQRPRRPRPTTSAAPGRSAPPRAATRRSIPNSARWTTSAAWSRRRASTALEIALDIAFQCAPDHPYVKEHPKLVPLAPRRQRAVRRESAEEIPGHLPVRFRDRGLARAVGRAEERVRLLDRRRRARSSASTTRTPSPSPSGNG